MRNKRSLVLRRQSTGLEGLQTELLEMLGGREGWRSNGPYGDASNQDMLTSTIDGLIARFGLQGERAGEVAAVLVDDQGRDQHREREQRPLHAEHRPPDRLSAGGGEQQECEQRPHAASVEWDGAAVLNHLQRPEDSKLHGGPVVAPVAFFAKAPRLGPG